jgi:hypothetical protein
MDESESVTIYGKKVTETLDAIRFKPLGQEPVWIPKSQVEEAFAPDPGGEGSGYIVIPEWLADDRDIE